jgi:CheY-like chemotaxis protein
MRHSQAKDIYRVQDTSGAAGSETSPMVLSADASRSGGRALIVAANPASVRLCRSILDNFEMAITVVDSGFAAVIAARDRRPDLILIDAQLRDVPGSEAIRWLRSNPMLESIPIIVLASNAGEDGSTLPAQLNPSPRRLVSAAALRRMVQEALK